MLHYREPMAHVITVVGCASGVGVTTTVHALACALHADNKTVRVIDTAQHPTANAGPNTDHATQRHDIETLISTHAKHDYILIDTDHQTAPLLTQLPHPVIVLATPDPKHLDALNTHTHIHRNGTSPLLGIAIVRTTPEETPPTRNAIASVIDQQLRNSCRVLTATIGDNGPEARRFRRDNYQSISGPLHDDWFALCDELTDLVSILTDQLTKTPERPRGGVGCPIGINNLTIDPHHQPPANDPTPNKLRKSLYLPNDLIEATKERSVPLGDQILQAVQRHRATLASGPLPKPNHDTTPHSRTRAYLAPTQANDLETLANTIGVKVSHLVAHALRLELGNSELTNKFIDRR